MIPKNVKIVSIISILLSLTFILIFANMLITSKYSPIWTRVIYVTAILCWVVMLVSTYLMLFGKKLGYYFYLIGWLGNIPNLNSLVGIFLYVWLLPSLDLLRNNPNVRIYLNLNDAVLEKPTKKIPQNNDRIPEYIIKCKKLNISDYHIKQALKNSGYTEEKIEEYFSSLKH